MMWQALGTTVREKHWLNQSLNAAVDWPSEMSPVVRLELCLRVGLLCLNLKRNSASCDYPGHCIWSVLLYTLYNAA
jgi:hypothetical protein